MTGPTTRIVTRALPVLFLGLAVSPHSWAQPAPGDAMAARLSAEKTGDIAAGSYSAGDSGFSLQPYGDKFLLRFDDSPETFVLGVDRVALGGRELKYDTGATAIRISVWGGMTLYTDRAPGGLPATRVGDAATPLHHPVSEADLAQALRDEMAHLSYAQKINLHFTAPVSDPAARGEAFDALLNTNAAIERVGASAAGHAALARRVENVRLTQGTAPAVSLAGRTVTVRFVPGKGPLGRLSSHAIAAELGKLLSVDAG